MGDATPAFRRGGEEAAKASKSSGARFARTNFLSIEDDGLVFLRYITDDPDWIFVNQHQGVPTKNKPADYEGNWPESMPAVCRHDPAFKDIHDDCYVCDNDIKNKWGRPNKATPRVWALACLREEVVATADMVGQDLPDGSKVTDAMVGRRIGFRDATREVVVTDAEGKPTDETKQERAIVVVNMAPNNYFNALDSTYLTYKQIYGDEATICDRDFAVKKTGKEKEVEYTHTPLDVTPNLKPGTESWKRYLTAIEEQKIDLAALVADRASDDYYARFFDPSKTVASKGSTSSATTPEVPAESAGEPDADRLAAMRERVRSNTGASGMPD